MAAWFNGEYFMYALAEWIACVIFISNPPKRAGKLKSAAVSAGMLVIQLFVVWINTRNQGLVPQDGLGMEVLKICLYIFLMAVHILAVCRIRIMTAIVLSLYAFLGAEMAWSFSLFGHYLILQNLGILTPAYKWMITAVVFIIVFSILFFIEHRIYAGIGWYTANWTDLILTAVITVICYILSNIYLVFLSLDWMDLWDNTMGNIPRWIFLLVGLFILYVRRIWKGYLQVQHELEMINHVFEKQKNQYEQARINAEVINQRYHDLKNQIAIMKADIPVEQQKEWLDGLEKKVEQIEPARLTGNPVLDTILWEKSQICTFHEIKLSFVMDGGLFEDIAIDDLCVIFGGALDNAIEAVLKIEDPERRLIHVKAMEQQGFLAICVENINDTPLAYKEGVLVTTKKDKESHGYGIKGIRYIAEKYGGTVTIGQEQDWFRLTVLLKKQI